MSDDAALPSPGDIVGGRYRVQAPIGAGGMGVVYRATQLNLGRDVALKVILPDHARARAARARFEREARVTSLLHHRNAVEIYDFGEHGESLFLAMELLRGQSLRELVDVDKPPLPVRRALGVATEIADALVAAARLGLVHRDLKPENIFLDRDEEERERVVVVDFGLAFITEREDDMGRLTRDGVATGTPEYMSPEQARGGLVGPASDVYSLGCVLHEMLTGHTPFSGDFGTLVARHLFVSPDPIREAFREIRVPRALDDLVLAMLEKEPPDRPSARTVREALTAIRPEGPERMGMGSGGKLLGRSARMISRAPSGEGSVRDSSGVDEDVVRVIVAAQLDPDLLLALAANGLTALPASQLGVARGVRAIFAPGATGAEVEELARHGKPIVTDAEASDLERLSALLRAGAHEVVIRPWTGDDAARKLLRAIRKARRKRS